MSQRKKTYKGHGLHSHWNRKAGKGKRKRKTARDCPGKGGAGINGFKEGGFGRRRGSGLFT